MCDACCQCNGGETEANPANHPGRPQQPESIDVATSQQIRLPAEPVKRAASHGAKVVEKPVWRAKGLPQLRISRTQLCADAVFECPDDRDPNHQCRQGYDQEPVHSEIIVLPKIPSCCHATVVL